MDASPTIEARDYQSRLETFFDVAGIPDPAGTASRLTARYRTLAELLSAYPIIVAEDAGSPAASAIAAARDLMVHAAADELRTRTPQGPNSIATFLKELIGFRCDECIVAIYLDARQGVIDHEVVTLGRADHADLDQRRIVLRAIARGAVGIIIAHNHPSGDPRPSNSDARATRVLADACQAVGVDLRDHLVVAGNQVKSAMYDNWPRAEL